MLEESAHIPLSLRIPGIEGGRRIDEPFSKIDLAPTLLEAMDQPVPAEPSGKSWYPALAGEVEVPSEPILLEFDFNSTDGSRAEFEGASPAKRREGIQSYPGGGDAGSLEVRSPTGRRGSPARFGG